MKINPIKIQAKFFWKNNPSAAFVRFLMKDASLKVFEEMPMHDGFIITTLQTEERLTEVGLVNLANRVNKNPKFIRHLVQHSARQTRYIAMFGDSEYLHIFYGEHIGSVLKVV